MSIGNNSPNRQDLVAQFMRQQQEQQQARQSGPGGSGGSALGAIGDATGVPGLGAIDGITSKITGPVDHMAREAPFAPWAPAIAANKLGDLLTGVGKSVGTAASSHADSKNSMSDLKSMLMGQGLQGLPQAGNAPPPMDKPNDASPAPWTVDKSLDPSTGQSLLAAAAPGGISHGMIASLSQRQPPGQPPIQHTTGDVLSDNDLDDQQRMMRPGQPRMMNKFRQGG